MNFHHNVPPYRVVKHSTRTIRQDCSKCNSGRLNLYWGVADWIDGTSRFVLVDANEQTRALVKGGMVPADSLHHCTVTWNRS